MNDYKIISSYDMGMQVSFGLDSKISEESIVGGSWGHILNSE